MRLCSTMPTITKTHIPANMRYLTARAHAFLQSKPTKNQMSLFYLRLRWKRISFEQIIPVVLTTLGSS